MQSLDGGKQVAQGAHIAEAAQVASQGHLSMCEATALGVIVGAAFVLILFIGIPWVFDTRKRLDSLWLGVDGRPSTSKFQFWLWSTVILFGYVFLFVVRSSANADFLPLPGFPRTLMIAMGLSGGTLVAAKGITTGSVQSGKVDKSVGTASSLGGLITDDAGQPDLPKIQLLAWTFIAVAVFLLQLFVIQRIAASPGLPDIDSSLLVLMGLGQGAYLGKKLVTTDTPRLLALAPANARPGATVALSGASLGDQKASQLTFDGVVVGPTVLSWTDARVEFILPMTRPMNGASWQDGDKVQVGIISEGVTGVGQQTLTVGVTPVIQGVAPTSPAGDAKGVTITGAFFGSTSAQVLVNGAAVPAGKWTDVEIQFDMPVDTNTQKPWPSGTSLDVCVAVGGWTSKPWSLTVR